MLKKGLIYLTIIAAGLIASGCTYIGFEPKYRTAPKEKKIILMKHDKLYHSHHHGGLMKKCGICHHRPNSNIYFLDMKECHPRNKLEIKKIRQPETKYKLKIKKKKSRIKRKKPIRQKEKIKRLEEKVIRG